MKLQDFTHDQNTGIYMSESSFASTFEYTDGLDVEKRLLGIIEAATDIGSTSKELENFIIDWPSRYHLSSKRANLFRALDNLPDETHVLELGAGCGALTRYLGERFAKVDAVEGSFLRSRITKERCRDLPNVAVYVAPFKDIDFAPEYDIVTLIGVLEYAPMFNGAPERNPAEVCLSLLRLAESGLKQDGILILAIENALGLKYWSGCAEDHTGKVFEGIHGYPSPNSPITFSRKELHNLVRQAGLDYAMFYYPFPDYKLPDTIIREDHAPPNSLFLHNWITCPFEDYSGKRDYYLNENLAIRSLCRADLLYEFANSFLVLASRSPRAAITASWVARRFATERALPYEQVTSLYADPSPRIEKARLFDSPSQPSFLRLKAVTPTWVPGDLEIYSLYETLFQSDVYSALLRIVKRYHMGLVKKFATAAVDSEGYPLLGGDSFDFTFWNIILNDRTQQYEYIDNEWEWDSTLPVDYVLFRSLYYFALSQRPYLKARLPNRDLETMLIDLMRELYPQYDSRRHQQNRFREEMAQTAVVHRNVSLPSLSAPLAERTNIREMIEQLERARTELSERDSKIRALEAESACLVEQLERARTELVSIKESFGYSLMRFYSSILHRLLPDNTKRGDFRKIVVAALRIARKEGFGSLCRQAWEKTKRTRT